MAALFFVLDVYRFPRKKYSYGKKPFKDRDFLLLACMEISKKNRKILDIRMRGEAVTRAIQEGKFGFP
jgi:hypothetical protein